MSAPLPTSSPPPWWAHYLAAAIAIGAGVFLVFAGDPTEGVLLIGAAMPLLGIGSAAALQGAS